MTIISSRGNGNEMKRIEQATPAWERSLALLALNFLNVVQCPECGAANAEGYICSRCEYHIGEDAKQDDWHKR